MKKQLITLLFCTGTLGSIAQTTFTLDVVAEGNFGTPNADVFRRNTTVNPATTSGGIYQTENSTAGFDVLQDFVVYGNNAIIAEKPVGVGRVTIVSYPSLTEIHTFPTSDAPQTLKFVSATKAYVSMGNPGGLSLIDLSNNTMTPVIDPSNNVNSYASHMESANGILYAALGSIIVKVDVITNTVLGTINPSLGSIKGLKYIPQTNKLWVINGSGSIVFIDITNGDALGSPIATGVSSTKLLRTYNGNLYFWGANKNMYIYNINTPASLPLTSSYTSTLPGASWSFAYGRSFDVDTTTGDFVICSANTFSAPGYYEVVDGSTFSIIESSSIVGCAIPNRCILKTFDSNASAPIPDVANLVDITAECTTALSAPTADNGAITATTTDLVSYSSQGSFTVNWTYSNGGQTVTQTQNVIINDITNPVAVESILDTLWINCNETITTFPTATDNCSGAINGTTTNLLNYTTAGTNVITWTYTDDNNNSSSQAQIVIVSCETNEITELSTLNFDVYPNPTDGMVTITNIHALTYSGTVTTLNGKIVSILNASNLSNATIDLYDLPTGIYVLRLMTTDGQFFTRKLVIK